MGAAARSVTGLAVRHCCQHTPQTFPGGPTPPRGSGANTCGPKGRNRLPQAGAVLGQLTSCSQQPHPHITDEATEAQRS